MELAAERFHSVPLLGLYLYFPNLVTHQKYVAQL